MPHFAFTAINDKGREYRGREDAISEAALEARLRKMGHWIAKIQEIQPGWAFGTHRDRPVPARDLTEFFLQLSLQLRAGVPLLTALSSGLGESGHARLKPVLTDVVDRVQSGEVLSQALAAHPRIFSRLIVNLLKSGEASGKLPELCNQIRLYLEWQERLRGDIRQALTYPLFVLGSAMLFVLVVFTFLVPRFEKLLTELNVALPWITRVMLTISQSLVHHGLLWMALAGGLGIAVVSAYQSLPKFTLWVDQRKLKLPILGPMIKMISLSRFAQNLAVLYQAGIPLLDALRVVAGLTGNRVVEAAVLDLGRAVNEGRQMHTAMAGHPVFSGLVVQMVSVGETTGNLGVALENVASYYNEVLPRQVKRMFAMLEPMLILGLVGFVGLVALSIFLPIVSLINVR